jgi:hypothetical protein
MQYFSGIRFVVSLLGALGLVAGMAAAADAQNGAPGVAYVSALNGDVSVQRGDSGEVEAAAVNAPVMVGDYLLTGPNGRAEVQFDYGHMVRLGANTQLRFDDLDPSADSVQLAAGTVGLAVLHTTSGYSQVETPSVTIQPREAGYYRVAVESDGTTEITVRSGNAAILLPQGTRSLRAGSTMYVSGPASSPSYRYVHPTGDPSFDQWNNDRDLSYERSNAYRYAPDSIPGAYALDSYGQWQNSPQYGNEWIPTDVNADWSPYSSGQWTDEPYYGWTWVDNDPWGYAPFHYGRWFRDQRRNRWAWAPGSRNEAAQGWSPALVAFVGFGGVGVSIELTNSIGWVPLAPNEQPHPWWGSGARNYSATNVSNIRSSYANARWASAVRAVPRQSFASGRYQRTAPVAGANLNHVIGMRAALPVAPDPQSLRYTQRAAAPAVRRPSAQAFHAFKATPHSPQAFAQQRTAATAIVQHASRAPVAAQRSAAQPQRKPAVVAQPQKRPATAAQPQHRAATAAQPPQRPPTAVQPRRVPAVAPARPQVQVQRPKPVTQAPRQAPAAQAPRQAPVMQAPRQAPVMQAPRQAPAVQAPRQAPAVQAPRQAPVMQAPRQAPVMQAPRQAPVMQAPRQAPVMQAPRQAPVMQAPRQAPAAPRAAAAAPRAAPPAAQKQPAAGDHRPAGP